MALEITEQNFDDLVIKSGKPVVLDFWAEWCGPCRMISGHIEQLAKDYEGRVIVGKVNIDNYPDIAAKYNIRNIPTVLFIKDGEVKDKNVGAASLSTFSQKLDNIL